MERGPVRRELEAAWQRRVSHAQARYREKAAIARLLMSERRALAKNEGFDPDGALALHQALRRESEALREHRRVLTIFSESLSFTEQCLMRTHDRSSCDPGRVN